MPFLPKSCKIYTYCCSHSRYVVWDFQRRDKFKSCIRFLKRSGRL